MQAISTNASLQTAQHLMRHQDIRIAMVCKEEYERLTYGPHHYLKF